MLAALLVPLARRSGASSHDGWIRHHYRQRSLKKEFAKLAAELKELHSKAKPTEEMLEVLEPFKRGEQIRWLMLAQDAQAIEAFLNALDAQRALLSKQQAAYDEIEAIQILHMGAEQDRELVRKSLTAIMEILH